MAASLTRRTLPGTAGHALGVHIVIAPDSFKGSLAADQVAEALAEALGTKLGPLCTLSTQGGAPFPMANRALAAPMPAKGRRVPIEAGTIQLSSEVSASFAVAP